MDLLHGRSTGRGVDPQSGDQRADVLPLEETIRWAYVGLEVDQVRQMKQLQVQNTRMKQLVAELSLDETILQDVLREKW
jgi:hypothetical protein